MKKDTKKLESLDKLKQQLEQAKVSGDSDLVKKIMAIIKAIQAKK